MKVQLSGEPQQAHGTAVHILVLTSRFESPQVVLQHNSDQKLQWLLSISPRTAYMPKATRHQILRRTLQTFIVSRADHTLMNNSLSGESRPAHGTAGKFLALHRWPCIKGCMSTSRPQHDSYIGQHMQVSTCKMCANARPGNDLDQLFERTKQQNSESIGRCCPVKALPGRQQEISPKACRSDTR